MPIFHYASSDDEIVFLSKTLQQNINNYFPDIYYCFNNDHKEFLLTQLKREQKFDVSIITSHGSNHGILRKIDDYDFLTIIGDYDYKSFLGNIILSISCYTATDSGFGEYLIERGAITYIGFNSSIEEDLVFKPSGNYEDNLNKIFSSTYSSAISLALKKMIYEIKSAQQFIELIDFYFQNLATDITFTAAEEINKEFGATIDDDEKIKLTVDLIKKLNILNRKLVILGDKNSIIWDSINYIKSIDQIDNAFIKIRGIDDKNARYKTKLSMNLIIKALQIGPKADLNEVSAAEE